MLTAVETYGFCTYSVLRLRRDSNRSVTQTQDLKIPVHTVERRNSRNHYVQKYHLDPKKRISVQSQHLLSIG